MLDNSIGHIVFRCDASPEIGSGHVMRCLTLAHYLSHRGGHITFASTQESLQAVPLLNKSGFDIRHDEPGLKADWLVVDHYGLDAQYETAARSWARKIFVIDDLPNRLHDCDVLLDQTYNRKASDYEDVVGRGCIVFCGAEYALLRPEFNDARSASLALKKERNGDVKNILIFMGGTNVDNITSKVLQAFEHITVLGFNLNIILSRGAKYFESAISAAKEINDKGFHAAHVHIDTGDMASLMANADIAIGAGGTTSWERCCLGLPSLVFVLADNQIKITEELASANAVINMGSLESFSMADFNQKITFLLNNPEEVLSMSRACNAIQAGQNVHEILNIF